MMPAIIPTQNELLTAASDAIFEVTPPFVVRSEGVTDVHVVHNTIRHVFRQSVDLNLPPHETPMLSLFSADVIRRGLIDSKDVQYDDQYQAQVEVMLRQLNATRELFDSPEVSTSLIMNIGYMAFCNVIFRPNGLSIPSVSRRLHTNDLGDFRSDTLAEAFRHRHNYLVRIIEQGLPSASKGRALQGFITDDGIPDIDKFAETIRTNPQRISPKTIVTMARIGLSQMAHRVIALDFASPEESNWLKEHFIELGYGIIEEEPALQEFGKEALTVGISEQAARHILAGDKNGGGHRLASLDNQFVKQVGPIESIDYVSKTGLVTKIPVSRVFVRNEKGITVSDTVTSFFPADWSEEQTLNAIEKPVRYMYGRDNSDGTSEDYVMSKGILIKRIYTDDDERQLITAFPSIVIPPDVKKRLSGNK